MEEMRPYCLSDKLIQKGAPRLRLTRIDLKTLFLDKAILAIVCAIYVICSRKTIQCPMFNFDPAGLDYEKFKLLTLYGPAKNVD